MLEIAKMFKALGNPTRLRIFLMLKQKTLCVCEIQQVIGCSMATLSSHLKLMKDAGLIVSNKENKFMNYLLNLENSNVIKLLELLKYQNESEIDNDIEMVENVDRNIICKLS